MRARALEEVERAHRAIGGSGRGRRYATLQVNHAYAVLLASQFQGFCRDLHTECIACVAGHAHPSGVRQLLQDNMALHRKLDRENANAGNIGADFNRLGIYFWDEIKLHDARTLRRMQGLESLNQWRNAIAHQDFTKVGSSALQLSTVRSWRRICTGLAQSFDAVLYNYLRHLTGAPPW